METRKDIGQAFKERLSEFKDSPNNLVWENIETELKKDKDDSKIFPLWFNYSKVGIILLLLLFINRESLINSSYEEKQSFDKHKYDTQIKNSVTKNKESYNNSKFKNDSKITEGNTITEVESYSLNSKKNQNNNKPVNTIKANKKSKRNTNTWSKNSKKYSNNSITNSEENSNKIEKLSKTDSKETSDASKEISGINSEINDSIQTNTLEEKALADNLLKDKNEEKTKDSILKTKEKRWSIYPNISLIHYGGFSSYLSQQTSINYGIYLNFLATEKTSVRFGLNKLNLSYTFKNSNNEVAVQNVEYIEIPLEIKYALTNTKIKTSVIGGVSYLILNKSSRSTQNIFSFNNIYSESTLSLNAGIEFQTKIIKDLYFNLGPIFKYQFEPNSDLSEFKPYTISIISGLEYRF